MERLFLGSAYYNEYMPAPRIEEDVKLMKEAGFNTIRVAESTWSTYEKEEGVFDFSTLTDVLDVCDREGIHVIVGTPTYAVPGWLVRKYPKILAKTKDGRGKYGPRQIMDITNPDYLFHAERIIRRLMEVSAHRDCVIGFQLDNETKYYGVAGQRVQKGFVKFLKKRFGGDIEKMNKAFGLDYWSNRIDDWKDFPDVTGTINGSLAAAFDEYRRGLVTQFLSWQAGIVREYAKPSQFLTHNMDFDWRDYSFGMQRECDHRQVSALLDVCGCDIYHPSQNDLTGFEIAFGGDMIRSLKHKPYLVLETQAQGFPARTPFPGQLRLNAYAHLANGAKMVEYWPWHSIHNSFETYWKGVLSQDLTPNAIYREAAVFGREWKEHGKEFALAAKKPRAAVLVSNRSLTAMQYFKIDALSGDGGTLGYNDVLRSVYDRLVRLNIETDMVYADAEDGEVPSDLFAGYDLLVVPSLYAEREVYLERIRDFVAAGGTCVATFKTGFADENNKVYADLQPHILREAAGVYYQSFMIPDEEDASVFGELLVRTVGNTAEESAAEVILTYEEPAWKDYAAAVRNPFGKGIMYYLGTMPGKETLEKILSRAAGDAGIPVPERFVPADGSEACADHGVLIRRGTNDEGQEVTYYLNFSGKAQMGRIFGGACTDVLTGRKLEAGEELEVAPWDLLITCAK